MLFLSKKCQKTEENSLLFSKSITFDTIFANKLLYL